MNTRDTGQEPPVPAVVITLTEMTSAEVTKNRLILAAFGLLLGAIALGLYVNEHPVWAGLFGLGAVLLLALIFSAPAKIAPCPYCGERNTGALMESENQEIQCEKCREYLLVDKGTVRALDPSTERPQPHFAVPAFQGAAWPDGCAACGAPPTRTEQLKSSSVNAAMLLAGRVRLMSGTVSGVPYCAQHKDAVVLSVSQDRSLELKWSSLRMMRRYLALNRGKEPVRLKRF